MTVAVRSDQPETPADPFDGRLSPIDCARRMLVSTELGAHQCSLRLPERLRQAGQAEIGRCFTLRLREHDPCGPDVLGGWVPGSMDLQPAIREGNRCIECAPDAAVVYRLIDQRE